MLARLSALALLACSCSALVHPDAYGTPAMRAAWAEAAP